MTFLDLDSWVLKALAFLQQTSACVDSASPCALELPNGCADAGECASQMPKSSVRKHVQCGLWAQVACNHIIHMW